MSFLEPVTIMSFLEIFYESCLSICHFFFFEFSYSYDKDDFFLLIFFLKMFIIIQKIYLFIFEIIQITSKIL
jgi:hypothetical protein